MVNLQEKLLLFVNGTVNSNKQYIMKTIKKAMMGNTMMKSGGAMKKAKDGSSFAKLAPPYDKATYADKIAGATKGKAKSGTKMKMGGSIKKAQTGNAIIDKASKDYKSYSAGTGPKPPLSSGFKNGGSTKKAQGGIRVVPHNLNERQIKRVERIAETNPERARRVSSRISDRRNARGAETSVKPMKSGGSMKKCKYGCK